ncbi:PREDICTED: myozenin-3 isoform X1 [Chinchilla lanigera]|uniref:myozenin-3 isoform X1 n=1 Tax=Chinchilla lanigera TaxID=34839 RepID=UPI00038EBE3F|nr:PREDICTED: myozenin-3 isoform X1 [Chinchilla lanigera]XP_005380627.1 PREDICTED: myozenin-3 isoform X1 [Chinchilla lanigera]
MIPKEQQDPAMTVMGDIMGPEPSLDLGKKVSVPQDLMIEELSLRNNRGSLLFQKRQRRVQRFTFELAASQQAIPARSTKGKVTEASAPQTVSAEGTRGGSAPRRYPPSLISEPGAQVANCPEGQNYRSELHVLPASSGDPGDARPAAARKDRARSPSALAPGYAEPLKSVPPEKFNHTAVPKGYRCPWQEFVSYRDYSCDGRSHTPSLGDCRNFNKTPVPFGRPFMGDAIPRAATSFVLEPFNGLELLRLRPSFNRVAQGWVRNLPESDEL